MKCVRPVVDAQRETKNWQNATRETYNYMVTNETWPQKMLVSSSYRASPSALQSRSGLAPHFF